MIEGLRESRSTMEGSFTQPCFPPISSDSTISPPPSDFLSEISDGLVASTRGETNRSGICGWSIFASMSFLSDFDLFLSTFAVVRCPLYEDVCVLAFLDLNAGHVLLRFSVWNR
ncbi:hypothetical protein M8C21_020483 [Ambrosia artemisiifolia]|uniref:Uncharacterized protein n=1 Tax=Ambrosia artemisiifolia TaxID=4212 RepID=A0AAD5BRE8_AMBAR|nr:hypothetical protein M8C21_020483 [Ambrosia artemisiifolia]